MVTGSHTLNTLQTENSDLWSVAMETSLKKVHTGEEKVVWCGGEVVREILTDVVD